MEKTSTTESKRDLTQGSVIKKLIMFALPLIASFLIMQLYNVADSIVVGNFVGPDALAAVSVSFPIMMFFNALYMGVSTGATVVISQYYGAKDEESLEKASSTTFTLTILVGVIITVLGIFLSKPILQLLKTPDNIINDSAAYLAIVFAGTLGSLVYSIGSGVLRGLGDSKWPMYFLIFSSILNVSLNLLFVIVFNMGVPGVAWATMIAHFASGVLVYYRVNRGGYGIRFNFKKMKIDWQIAKIILKLGLPSGIQSMAMSLGSMIIQSFANRFGSTFIAANNSVMRADGFAILPMMAIGSALTTFVGQNIGAGKIDRAKKGIKSSALIIIGIGVIMGAVMWFNGSYVIRAFTDDPIVLEIGERGIRTIAWFYSFIGLEFAFAGAMRGAGASVAPMVTTLSANLCRIPIAYFLAVVPNDYMGLFYSMVSSMIIGTTLIFLYYLKGNWRNKSVARQITKLEGKAE
ncbi:MAG: MATE family efflux transporter [Eubacteriales bacterium]